MYAAQLLNFTADILYTLCQVCKQRKTNGPFIQCQSVYVYYSLPIKFFMAFLHSTTVKTTEVGLTTSTCPLQLFILHSMRQMLLEMTQGVLDAHPSCELGVWIGRATSFPRFPMRTWSDQLNKWPIKFCTQTSSGMSTHIEQRLLQHSEGSISSSTPSVLYHCKHKYSDIFQIQMYNTKILTRVYGMLF